MPNFAAALPLWNTRPTWKSCKNTPLGFTHNSLTVSLLVLSLLLLPHPAIASPEAHACSQSLGKPLPGQQAGLQHTLHLLIWNIEKSGNSGWEADLQALASNSDLILIQEASVQAQISTVMLRPFYGAFAAGYTTEALETGVLTLSTVEPSLQCNLTAWEPWLGTPKATNITEYPVQGQAERLLVINLHAVNFSVGLEEFEEQILALAPLLHNHRGPLIVAGDFNTWSKSRMRSLDSFMLSHQLSSVPFTPDLRTRIWKMPLDHVYLRGLNLISASTVKVKTSDHNPLSITIEIPDA